MWNFIPWERVDWRKLNFQIAVERDCTTATVRQKRKALGLPPQKILRLNAFTYKISLMKTARMTVREIAQVTGCSCKRTRDILCRSKIPYTHEKAGGTFMNPKRNRHRS